MDEILAQRFAPVKASLAFCSARNMRDTLAHSTGFLLICIRMNELIFIGKQKDRGFR